MNTANIESTFVARGIDGRGINYQEQLFQLARNILPLNRSVKHVPENTSTAKLSTIAIHGRMLKLSLGRNRGLMPSMLMTTRFQVVNVAIYVT